MSKKLVDPCLTCPEAATRHQWALTNTQCNHGMGICKPCMDYHEALGAERVRELISDMKKKEA